MRKTRGVPASLSGISNDGQVSGSVKIAALDTGDQDLVKALQLFTANEEFDGLT
jgi:hypothetical protein